MTGLVAHDAFRMFAFVLAALSVAGGIGLIWYSVNAPEVAPGTPPVPKPTALPQSLRLAPDTYLVLERLPSGHLVEVGKSPCRIGRHSTDDIAINDVRVSRHHARIERTLQGTIEIHNETASRSEPNPMLVNGVYRETAVLKDGDIVSLGGVELKVHSVPSP